MTTRVSGTEIVPSLAAASAEELAEISELTAPERAWYADRPRYATNEDILTAAKRGELVPVTGDANLRLIGRLRNPEWEDRFPPYLIQSSALALRGIGREWRAEMDARGLSSGVQLAVTSLARSQETQDALVADPTKLAEPFSTHVVGAAFDIDASAYFEHVPGKGGGRVVSVVHPRRSKAGMSHISEILRESAGPKKYEMVGSSALYEPEVIESLLVTLDALHELGYINRIVEYRNTGNQCVHVCPNPEAPWWRIEPRTL